MRVLTDTHTLVWALSAPERLSARARKAVGGAEFFASVANLWELVVKMRKKDTLLTDPLRWWEDHVVGSGIPTIGVRVSHVMALGRLPEIHRDPFDRILLAQSIVEKAPLVSKDAHLAEYGVPIIW